MWDTPLPSLWKGISTSHRVLIVEAPFAEQPTAAVAGIPGILFPVRTPRPDVAK